MSRRVRWWKAVAGALVLLLPQLGHGASTASKTANGPGIKSAAALVLDVSTGKVLYEQDAATVTPIASVTKLMTALVVLDGQQSLDDVIKITADDRWKGKGAFSHIPNGAKLTRGDLLRLALMASENLAARTLARHYPGGIPMFVKTMNIKAKALGMSKTHYEDASGLSSANVSTARDLAKLIAAVSRQPLIREFSTLPSHEVVLNKRAFIYRNTNLLIGKSDWEILVQKTGFTNDAGQCLVMEAVIGERPVVMVFLNSFGSLTRTADARRVRKWLEAQQPASVASVRTTTAK
jgi:D-alanyl-D-alanine endopeptidase (penicillin-binding protein 7)